MKSLWIEILEEFYRNIRQHRHLLYEDWEELERIEKERGHYSFPGNMSTPNLAWERKPPAEQGHTMQERVNEEWEDVRRKALQLTQDIWEDRK